jgi:hypothetical protein
METFDVYRPDNCLLERDRFDRDSVMKWAEITGGRKTDLVVIRGNLNAQRYIDEFIVPFLR